MDPLRPFTGLIRTLWKSTSSKTSTEQARGETAVAVGTTTLRSQIRSRLTRVGVNDPRLAREAFVETVLTAELGENLANDPAFAEMVKRVAEHIAADDRLGGQLHALLCSLAEESPPV